MDSLTHIVLGACIGELFVGRKVRKRALIFGALAQSVPDIDFVTTSWLSPADDLLSHRGFTHSLLFALLVTPLLAWLADRIRRPHDVPFRTWLLFFATEIGTHLFLDTANAYGTGLLEPFSHARFSYHSLFVADPFFSIIPGLVMVVIIFLRSHTARARWAWAAVAWCAVYWGISLNNKRLVEKDLKAIAAKEHIPYRRFFTTPTPLNNMLWYAVLEDERGYHITYRSVLDKPLQSNFHYFTRNDSLLQPYRQQHEVQQLITFSQGYYTTQYYNDTLVFNDLRFGQVTGWMNPANRFAFYYYLQQPDNNQLLIQRGRFANWDKQTLKVLWRRMRGKQ